MKKVIVATAILATICCDDLDELAESEPKKTSRIGARAVNFDPCTDLEDLIIRIAYDVRNSDIADFVSCPLAFGSSSCCYRAIRRGVQLEVYCQADRLLSKIFVIRMGDVKVGHTPCWAGSIYKKIEKRQHDAERERTEKLHTEVAEAWGIAPADKPNARRYFRHEDDGPGPPYYPPVLIDDEGP